MSRSNLYVAFEGPLGAGKTTLATELSKLVDGLALLERLEENDYLADFYKDHAAFAVQMQLSFLVDRVEHLKSLSRDNHRIVVADYTFAKDQIFAELLLQDRDLKLYRKICSSLERPAATPDVVVLLDAPNDVLLRRIEKRGRNYEKRIDAQYLESVRTAYEQNKHLWQGKPVIAMDTTHIDPNSKMDITDLAERIWSCAP